MRALGRFARRAIDEYPFISATLVALVVVLVPVLVMGALR